MSKCCNCDKELTLNEIGLFKKTVDRISDQYLCIDCLALRFETTRDSLEKMIERLRAAGCTLFI